MDNVDTVAKDALERREAFNCGRCVHEFGFFNQRAYPIGFAAILYCRCDALHHFSNTLFRDRDCLDRFAASRLFRQL